MKKVEIGGKMYPVKGMVESSIAGGLVPLVDIPMMSDERWNQLAREQAGETRKELQHE